MNQRLRLHLVNWCLLCALAAVSATVHTAGPREQPELTTVLDKASRRFEQQDYEGARRDYERATKLDPGSLRAWRGLGWSLWQLGEHDHAYRIWSNVAKVQPDDPGVLFALGQAHEYREEPERAIDLYSRAIRQRPRHRPALMGRARVYQSTGRLAAAESDLQAVLKLKKSDFEAQFMLAQIYKATGREEMALGIYERLARQDPGRAYLRPLADMLLELGRVEEAIRYYRQNLEKAPGNRGSILGLARAHARLHQYTPAIEQLEGYLTQHPDDAKIREELARLARDAGDYERAETNQRILVRAHPEEIKWRLSLAQILQSAGKVEEPVQIAQQVLKEEPDNLAALEILLGNAIFAARQEEAIQWLERLSELDPSAKRLGRIGDFYIRLGDEHAAKGRTGPAQAAYEKSVGVFRRAKELYPGDADAFLGVATALRLAGRYQEALSEAEQIATRYPAVERAQREIYESRLALEDYAGAEAALLATLKVFPGNMRFQQELARVRFKSGRQKQAIEQVGQLLREPIRPSVPVLLYHGISLATTREDTMSVHNFRDQMETLKREGYQPISIHRLLAFYEHGAELPPRPVLITFDDARADSFRYADPVLKQLGFKATMFTPVAEVGQHGAFNAVWDTIREMHRSGRWDIQCHSTHAHESIPVDAQGTEGNFLANRKWLEKEGRLETREEYIARLSGDYRACGEELVKKIPGLQLAGYSYPFGEMGQKFASNMPEAVAVNNELAVRHYKLAFLQDPAAEVTRTTGPASLPRIEVPWNFTGQDLLNHLRDINAHTSTQLLLADLYSWDGQYASANAIFEELSRSAEVDRTALLIRRGRVAMWLGDFTQARRHLESAAESEPEDPLVKESLAQLEARLRPTAWFEVAGYDDNQDRASMSIGPSLKRYLSDRLILTTDYRYRRIENKDFDISQLGTGGTGTADLLATGHEIKAELEYRHDWRTLMTFSGGVAKFDNDSSGQLPDGSETFPLASVSLSRPLGEDADMSLRLARGYVNAAGAILDGMGTTSGEGRLEYRFLSDMKFEGRYTHLRYDGGNVRSTGTLAVFKEVRRKPEVQIGYRFMYDDTREQNPFFYTPDHFIGNDAVIRLEAKPNERTTLGLEGSLGVGREAGESMTQASLLATGQYRLNDRFSLYFNGGRSESASFRSHQLAAGLLLTY